MERSEQAPHLDERQTSGAVDFDAAFDAYLSGGGTKAAEALLQAAGIVIDCRLPLGPTLAEQVSRLTGESIEIEDYADAAHAIRRWFAAMPEDGFKH
jgi:hypothetical protein